MTVRKHFKQIVRDRMKKTGESYTSARRQLLIDKPSKPADPRKRWHFPGCGPATTSLRVLLAAAGVKDPLTGEPFSEAMLFGIAGGVGIGVAAFHYAKADISCFFIAGRHLWFDDLTYLQTALGRLGIKPTVKEGGVKGAEKQLREMLEKGPCIAWVDSANLPHRAMPAVWSGGGYHIVTVYKIEDDHALIGDLTDEPVSLTLAELATTRARIVKQKNRLLSIPVGRAESSRPASSNRSHTAGLEDSARPTIQTLVREGLSACHKGLTMKGGKGAYAMSTLNTLKKWADRLHGSKDKDGWEKTFRPGANLWRGLTSIYLFIENYGTGGGLCRPMMADFLNEAGAALKDTRIKKLAEQYAELGRGWSELADAALPDSVAKLREAKELYNRYAELFTAGGAIEEKKQVWVRLDELEKEAKAKFPLSDQDCADLRADLQARVRNLITAEEAALAAMAEILK